MSFRRQNFRKPSVALGLTITCVFLLFPRLSVLGADNQRNHKTNKIRMFDTRMLGDSWSMAINPLMEGECSGSESTCVILNVQDGVLTQAKVVYETKNRDEIRRHFQKEYKEWEAIEQRNKSGTLFRNEQDGWVAILLMKESGLEIFYTQMLEVGE